MKKKSLVMQIMSQVWSNLDYTSHQRVNSGMNDLLRSLINIGVKFEPNDVKDIYESFRGGYWFGVSRNGKTMGEHFYFDSNASNPNVSFSISFEKWRNRKPFIINNHRLTPNSTLKYKNLFCTVTGFDDKKGLIFIVGYTDSWNSGQRKLYKFDNKQFLEVRKEMTLI